MHYYNISQTWTQSGQLSLWIGGCGAMDDKCVRAQVMRGSPEVLICYGSGRGSLSYITHAVDIQ